MKTPIRLTAFAAPASALLISAVLISGGSASAQPPPQQQGPDLHAILHIRPDQEAAWQAYKQGMTPPAGIIATLRSSAQRAVSMTTPQRLDLQEQNHALESTIFHHQIDAARKFYAALSPEQQRIYDQISTPRVNQGGPQR